MPQFYSNGKLLITGEYTVLDGALALAVPTVFGQYLTVVENNTPDISWQSLDLNDKVWFETILKFDGQTISSNKPEDHIAKTLVNIFQVAQQLNPKFLLPQQGFDMSSKLTFDRYWGLGSSSTLINNIANWAKVDAYELLSKTFGGSGYDIACAQHDTAINYQLKHSLERTVTPKNFNPSFKTQLYFVYLNKKQNSRQAIAHYQSNRGNLQSAIDAISSITKEILICKDAPSFDELITKHEDIISKLLNLPPVKEQYFKDFTGSIKSLGAWGGDFIMVRSDEDPKHYFKSKGFDIVIPFSEMVK